MQADKWSWKRFMMLVMIAAATAIAAVLVLMEGERTRLEQILVVLCSLIFVVFLALYLEWNRIDQGILNEKANNYARIAMCYVIAAALTVLASFIPGFMRPVMVAPAIMVLALDSFTGLMCSFYFSILLCLAGSEPVTMLANYLFLSMFGCILIRYIQRKGLTVWSCFMIIGSSFSLNTIFSVLEQKAFSSEQMLESLAGALMSCVGSALFFRLCNDRIENRRDLVLEHIIKDHYGLVNTMRNYSMADYRHARKVSRIASNCAKQIGADFRVCAAAGFYYRIGRLEGEPYVESGVILARKKEFPPEVVQILAEYNGEKLLPSTIESALVHIVDNMVAKFEVLDESTLSSSWNQDMIVYQTLNENTAQGLYDKSGLGMNTFRIIREYLVKEALLYDGYNGEQQYPDDFISL